MERGMLPGISRDPEEIDEMKTVTSSVVVAIMLLARCAGAAELSPVAFAKSVVSARGSQTFAAVSYPERSLIVEFRLEPYATSPGNVLQAFAGIARKVAPAAFGKFPKIRSVQLIGNLALRDRQGNEMVDRAVMMKFSRVKAAAIAWENLDPAMLATMADKQWIRPELDADRK